MSGLVCLFVCCCRLDNTAEKLFKEIEDKNGNTYEALIQGLVKVCCCCCCCCCCRGLCQVL